MLPPASRRRESLYGDAASVALLFATETDLVRALARNELPNCSPKGLRNAGQKGSPPPVSDQWTTVSPPSAAPTRNRDHTAAGGPAPRGDEETSNRTS